MAEPLPWLAKCVRPMLRAQPGTRFIGADLSSIEGRTNAWQAQEQWKLDAYLLNDVGLGPGIYELTAAGIVGIPIEAVTKAQRQAQGKIPDLACGFQGSVGAFVSMAANYLTKPEDAADVAAQTTPPDVWARTAAMYRPIFSAGLEPHIWTGIKVVVDGWRARHPRIVQSWWAHQDAAIEAVSVPGTIVQPRYMDNGIEIVLNTRYLCNDGFLFCEVATGGVMSYPQPRIVRVERVREKPVVVVDPATGQTFTIYEQEIEYRNAVEVWGLEKGQWRPYTLYGGLQVENVSQKIARDILDWGMKRIDRAGYPIVLHAHDEVLTECAFGFGTRQELATLLSMSDPRIAGLPLHAKAWEDERYVK